jgi:hypothetical protein
MSDIWTLDKKRLLVDSVINGYDIPKLYLHELIKPRKVGKNIQKFALIDGKQRLQALWDFMDGEFQLAPNFDYIHDPDVKMGRMYYNDIAFHYPEIKSVFDATSLAVVSVRTDDIELIEDMFSRLNEAVPLNAPEKRNAFGGPLPPVIRELAEHDFFRMHLPFSDKRYKHRDIATKLLLIENYDAVIDTKKAYLDSFVRTWAKDKRTRLEANDLKSNAEANLNRLCRVFEDNDTLLKSIGMVIIVYHLFRLLQKVHRINTVDRVHLIRFEEKRLENRRLAERNIAEANYDLLEFDKYVQTPNDAYATKIRLNVLWNFLREDMELDLPANIRYLDIR